MTVQQAADGEAELDAQEGVYSTVKDVASGLHPLGKLAVTGLGTLLIGFGVVKAKKKGKE